MALAVVYTNFGGQIVSEDRGGTKRDYVPDTLGSTIALVDDTETVTDTWEYGPYGELEDHTGASTTPFTFAGTLGYFRDLVSKQTYVRARYYQTSIGQWMTADPIWPAQHAYQYMAANPLAGADPSGMIAPILIACAVACGVCLACVAAWCGHCRTLDCWIQCIEDFIDQASWWEKATCGLACAGCLACLILLVVRVIKGKPGGGPKTQPPKTKPPSQPCPPYQDRFCGALAHSTCILEYGNPGSSEYWFCFMNIYYRCMSNAGYPPPGGPPIPLPDNWPPIL